MPPSPTNESIYRMSLVWRYLAESLHKTYYSEFDILAIDYSSPPPPIETTGRSGSSRITLSAIASAVSVQEARARARAHDPDAIIIDTISARHRVAGGYIDLAHLTSADADAISHFFRRILYIFGAPGDPIPANDEGRSARLRLLRYITMGLLHFVFGPWAPHSSLDTADGSLIRRVIITAVRASLKGIAPVSKSLSHNSVNTFHLISEMTPIRYRVGCLHEVYDQILTTGFISATGILRYRDVVRMSQAVIETLEDMIKKPAVLHHILVNNHLGIHIRQLYDYVHFRAPHSMPRRMNFLNQLWPDIFMDSIFSELIPGNSTPLEPGATGPLPFLTHIYHPVQQLSYIIILALCAYTGVKHFAERRIAKTSHSQIYDASKFTKADREVEDLESYRGQFEQVVLTFSLHSDATTHATTVATAALNTELQRMETRIRDFF